MGSPSHTKIRVAVVAVLFAVLVAFGMLGCSSGEATQEAEQAAPNYNVVETIETDVIEFTLDRAE